MIELNSMTWSNATTGISLGQWHSRMPPIDKVSSSDYPYGKEHVRLFYNLSIECLRRLQDPYYPLPIIHTKQLNLLSSVHSVRQCYFTTYLYLVPFNLSTKHLYSCCQGRLNEILSVSVAMIHVVVEMQRWLHGVRRNALYQIGVDW